MNLSDVVDLYGYTPNPYAFMSRVDAFVLSSKWEGLPNALIEALVCGAKVISTDCPSGPKEILDDGKYGSLVPVGDSKALSEAIMIELNKKRDLSSKKQWIKRWDAENIATRYIALFQQIETNSQRKVQI